MYNKTRVYQRNHIKHITSKELGHAMVRYKKESHKPFMALFMRVYNGNVVVWCPEFTLEIKLKDLMQTNTVVNE